ncbi:hypothetical protein CYLTODRAFT_456153 [Cylindrobasidium torrendii FP15055 ss-10]|uniref:Uncharacterized protein n=1 Tax=Cylindrobasidium torrendii FP15055 ss-10 TaxID=1314674 RepID=A0A0D7B612_9AGAR|nr:hypothetical protein CYLTODRAFT_456153 [Cylindrobasidium torrendii FP15055 ss-10]
MKSASHNRLRPLLRVKTSDLVHDDTISEQSLTPTIAYYAPPVPEKPEKKSLPSIPDDSTPLARMTFFALWDPESEQYTLPIGRNSPTDSEVDDEGFFDMFQTGHPDCEPHLPSRFSTSTTSTGAFIDVSRPQTPPPPAPTREMRNPSFLRPNGLPEPIRPTLSHTLSLSSLLSRKPTLSRPSTPTRKHANSAPTPPLPSLRTGSLNARRGRYTPPLPPIPATPAPTRKQSASPSGRPSMPRSFSAPAFMKKRSSQETQRGGTEMIVSQKQEHLDNMWVCIDYDARRHRRVERVVRT